MVNKVFLTKSLPGGGKSTLVADMTKDMSPNEFVVCCADDFLILNGKYVWSPERAGSAHMKSYRKFLESLIKKIPNIFISQCNLTWSQMKDYVKYGNLAGYEIWLLEPKTWWRYNVEVCYIMNNHGLSYEKLEDMKNRMQTNEQIVDFAQKNLGVEIHYEN